MVTKPTNSRLLARDMDMQRRVYVYVYAPRGPRPSELAPAPAFGTARQLHSPATCGSMVRLHGYVTSESCECAMPGDNFAPAFLAIGLGLYPELKARGG